MEWLTPFVQSVLQRLWTVVCYPVNPGERIFVVYLLSSLAFAVGAYFYSPNYQRDKEEGRGFLVGLFRFVFPESVWSHPSAWIDVRFFVPHQIIRLWIYTDFLMVFTHFSRGSILSCARSISGLETISTVADNNWLLVISFALISYMSLDFAAYVVHYLQHKVPILWEFHKIHHSSEVLHPLSNYREHPIDNFSYAISAGLSTGAIVGLFEFFFGVQPLKLLIPVLGVHFFTFAYDFLGYNLRHSHIWVRWPGFLAYFFGCPAHHQIHHSYKPKHINKNFAFMFPIWDVIFGTFYLPEQEEQLEIGLGDGTEPEYKGFFSIYTLPFVNLLKPSPDDARQTVPPARSNSS